jgi:NAD(P)H-dependent FMN reductase
MKKVLVFGGSSSKSSINKKLATYAASKLTEAAVNSIDLNDFLMPLFSVDQQSEFGIPEHAHQFLQLIQETDGIILSLAEHNGAYTVAFKNIFDWVSRIKPKLWSDKPMLLLSTSPGSRGAQSVLGLGIAKFPYMGAKITGTFSLPSFDENFKEGKLVDESYKNKLLELVTQFENSL